MQIGLKEVNGMKIYFAEDGKQGLGFQVINGKTYFFSRMTGEMRTGMFAIDGHYYYFDEEGVMQIGFQTIDGKRYFFSRINGARRTGMFAIDGYYYYFNEEGVMQIGFQTIDGKRYFFSRINGARRTGMFAIDGYYYYFNEEGVMQIGFQTIDGKRYFFSRINGARKTGLISVDGYVYYFNDDGIMQTGKFIIDNLEYEFGSDGKLIGGWQSKDGKTYFLKSDGSYVKGWAMIAGEKCFFNSKGELIARNAKKYIDVSYYQGTINWTNVKNLGNVDGAIIRAGYRGYGSGSLNEDSYFYTNIRGASNENLDIGVYFFSQAITADEAKAEANFVINMLKIAGKNNIFIAFDSEYANSSHSGRADSLSKSERTNVAIAFLETVKAAGYKPMLYASTNFLYNNLDMSKLSKYDVWVAQYNTTCTYTGDYVMWQYSSSGSVPGISGNVDMDVKF